MKKLTTLLNIESDDALFNYIIATLKTKVITQWDYFVKWEKVNNTDLKGYYIYRNTKEEGEFEKIASVSNIVNYYTDTLLNNGTKYFYKVKAYNIAKIESLFSNILSGIPFSSKAPESPKNFKLKILRILN